LAKQTINIAPQKGFQEKVLASPADIVICGAASGVGKSWLLLVEPLRHYTVPKFNATIFRRTFPQIAGPGGMWEKSMELYPLFGGTPVKSAMEWRFKKTTFYFRHFQHEDDWINFQGTEMCYIGFDEITQFTRGQFFKTFAWNRSTSGVKPYIRATCNPDPDSFVADMIDWYIGEDGFPIPERDGVIRYFVTIDDTEVWGDTRDELYQKVKSKLDLMGSKDPRNELIKSFTFIKGNVRENKALLEADPNYIANLMAMSEEEQMRFLHGNWKIKFDKAIIFNFNSFKDIFNNDFVKNGKGYITADIATTGRDCLIIAYWNCKRWEDIDIADSNNGKEAIDKINQMRIKHGVINSHILFDADGVGGGMTGFISNCVEFHAQKKPVGGKKMNYANIKSQCFFEVAKCINQDEPKTADDLYYISKEVAEYKYPYSKPSIYRGKTVAWIIMHQMRAIREEKPDLGGDRKKSIIKKDEQKTYLNGISPDFIEQFAFREYFELKTTGNRVIPF
jgi:hypothetical protein